MLCGRHKAELEDTWIRGICLRPLAAFPGRLCRGNLLEKEAASPECGLSVEVSSTEGQDRLLCAGPGDAGVEAGHHRTRSSRIEPRLERPSRSQVTPLLSRPLWLLMTRKAPSPPQFIFSRSRSEVKMLNLGGSCPRTDGHQVCDVINRGRISLQNEPGRGWEGADSLRISTFKK